MKGSDSIDQALREADATRTGNKAEASIVQADGARMARDQFSSELQTLFIATGRAQAAKAISGFSETLEVLQLAKIKETKEYRKLKGLKSGNGFQFLGTWEDFCERLVGRSYRKAYT